MKVFLIGLSVISISLGFSVFDEFDMNERNMEDDFVKTFEEKLFDTVSEVDPVIVPANALKGFSFTDCGGPDALVNINNVSLTPDPLQAPESLSVNFTINSELEAPVKLSVEISRKLFRRYVKIPCIHDVGSCDYDDMCDFLKDISSSDCPFASLGCSCPFEPNNYNVELKEVNLPIPVQIAGKYQLKIASSMDEKEVFCAQIKFSIKR